MTSKFIRAVTTKDTLGENLMPAHTTTGDALVDMLFNSGAARHWSKEQRVNLFAGAIGEDVIAAVTLLFYARDIRGGQGEREFFRDCFQYLANRSPEVAGKVLHLIPEYGRWDDVMYATRNTPLLDKALYLLIDAVRNGNGLAAKWAPREGKSDHRNFGKDSFFANMIRVTGLSPKMYRSLVAKVSNTVEDKMCADMWEEINYNHVPSQAFRIYRDAFFRHDEERFKKWLESLSDPESGNKVHAKTLYPHDLIREFVDFGYGISFKNLSNHQYRAIQAQWEELPDYQGGKDGILVMSDMSGSMYNYADSLPIQASIGLGVYFAEKLGGAFNNLVMTFSRKPYFIELPKEGTLVDKVRTMLKHMYVENTNLEAGLRLMLSRAKEHNLAEEDMPKVLLILSDMQFDRCTGNPTLDGMEMIREYYKAAGYACPHVVFWNLRATGTTPAKYDKRGVTLLSGYSPATMQFVLKGAVTPRDTLRDIITSNRYRPVIEALTE